MKRLTILISILILLSCFSIDNYVHAKSIDFVDIGNYWATEDIYWAVENGIITGYPNEYFKPKKEITEAEFVTILYKYMTNNKVDDLKDIKGNHWAHKYYNALREYKLPLGGLKDDNIKDSPLSRGKMAQMIAAKNGFNLTERQAVYYMYENDLSYGTQKEVLDFRSYEVESKVTREQVPAFFRRLDEKGQTFFKGEPSPIEKPREIAGVNGIVKDENILVDFDDFIEKAKTLKLKEEEKAENEYPPYYFLKTESTRYPVANQVAKKYGLYISEDTKKYFELRDKKGNYVIDFDDGFFSGSGFALDVYEYEKNKEIAFDVIRATGRLSEKNITDVENAINTRYTGDGISKCCETTFGSIEVSGDGIDPERPLCLQIYIKEGYEPLKRPHVFLLIEDRRH